MNEKSELLNVLKELHNVSSFRLSIHDTNFQEIEAFPKNICSFCKLIQQNEYCKNICKQNDRTAFQKVSETQKVYMYQCKFGLYEAVAPLYSFGTLTGYLMMGQMINQYDANRNDILSMASNYVEDKNKLYEAVAKIPSGNEKQILSCVAIMDICAKYITLSNRLTNVKSDLAHEVKKYIDQNYYKQINIDTLCKIFFCSKSTLINTYKKKYSQSINNYLINKRIEHACQLLSYTNKSIKEIALNCGFSEQNYFSKVFYKLNKKSPTEYRKQINLKGQ